MGISEHDFWNMTIAEFDRAIASKKRVEKMRAQEQASFDYILADLIGRSIGRIYSSNTKLPELAEAYPSLFAIIPPFFSEASFGEWLYRSLSFLV